MGLISDMPDKKLDGFKGEAFNLENIYATLHILCVCCEYVWLCYTSKV